MGHNYLNYRPGFKPVVDVASLVNTAHYQKLDVVATNVDITVKLKYLCGYLNHNLKWHESIMSDIKLIFLACKYTENATYKIQRNIWHASIYAQEVALLGAVPLCPALIGANFEGLQDYHWWGEGYIVLLRRCDAVFMVPGYERSNGATKEEVEALRLGMPVFYMLEDLQEWLRN